MHRMALALNIKCCYCCSYVKSLHSQYTGSIQCVTGMVFIANLKKTDQLIYMILKPHLTQGMHRQKHPFCQTVIKRTKSALLEAQSCHNLCKFVIKACPILMTLKTSLEIHTFFMGG